MKIARTSMLTGKLHIREIPITMYQLEKWERGELIHKAMPNISADDREFIISGITPDEWDKTFVLVRRDNDEI